MLVSPASGDGQPYELEALEVRRAPGGWAVVALPYWLQPGHDEDWAARNRETYRTDAAYRREMLFDTSATAGPRAYWAYLPQVHVAPKDLELQAELPVRLCCDFNVSPCLWEICQVVPVNLRPMLYVVDEVCLDPASVPAMAREVHQRCSNHSAGLWVYGDASGRARNAQTGASDYELLLRELRWYRGELRLMVAKANPPIRDRLTAVNCKLLDSHGVPGMLISPRCEEFRSDLALCEVDAAGILRKSTAPEDPYSKRGHAADGVGALVHWEWPVWESTREEQGAAEKQGRPKRPPAEEDEPELLGDLR